MGSVINAPPAIGMNFDGRMEIFGIGTDQTVYHNWQTSAGGPWSGWQSIAAPSNGAGTDTGEDVYFLSDADNDSNYANVKSQQCPANVPNPWRGVLNGRTYAWPCGAMVNVGISHFKKIKAFQAAISNWNQALSS